MCFCARAAPRTGQSLSHGARERLAAGSNEMLSQAPIILIFPCRGNRKLLILMFPLTDQPKYLQTSESKRLRKGAEQMVMMPAPHHTYTE